MSRTTGEALREKLTTIVMQARHNGNRSSPYSHEDYVRRIAAAIVDHLGITWADHGDADDDSPWPFDGFHHGDMVAEVRTRARICAALLDCAEVEP